MKTKTNFAGRRAGSTNGISKKMVAIRLPEKMIDDVKALGGCFTDFVELAIAEKLKK